MATFRARVLGSWYLGTGQWANEVTSVHGPYVAQRVRQAEESGVRLIWETGMWHAVAVAIPGYLGESVVEFLGSTDDPTDWAISDWCRYNAVPVAYPVPSLVDHRDGPRLIDRLPDGPRHAISFLGV